MTAEEIAKNILEEFDSDDINKLVHIEDWIINYARSKCKEQRYICMKKLEENGMEPWQSDLIIVNHAPEPQMD